MGKPQGPLPPSILRAAEVELAQELAAEEGRKRLKARLAQCKLREKVDVPSDGNCQFCALSDQLCDTFELAPKLRRDAVAWLRKHADWDIGNDTALADFVGGGGDWQSYCDTMARPGIWGDHLTLIALAEVLGAKISVVSSVEGDHYITEITPKSSLALKRVLLISHFAEFHYGSLAYIA
jgi:hypothetical protein